jgi:hypothetical protein
VKEKREGSGEEEGEKKKVEIIINYNKTRKMLQISVGTLCLL